MLSHQDTYYSDNEDCQFYFQDSEIHGTVDFICGAGDIWFERCKIVTEKRNLDGSGRNVIAAPRTSNTPWGYIFIFALIVDDALAKIHHASTFSHNPASLFSIILDSLSAGFILNERLQMLLRIAARQIE